jgi:hypothetical protein
MTRTTFNVAALLVVWSAFGLSYVWGVHCSSC